MGVRARRVRPTFCHNIRKLTEGDLEELDHLLLRAGVKDAKGLREAGPKEAPKAVLAHVVENDVGGHLIGSLLP